MDTGMIWGPDGTDNAKVVVIMSSLSAIGSNIVPATVLRPYLLAIYPSMKSVMLENAKRPNAGVKLFVIMKSPIKGVHAIRDKVKILGMLSRAFLLGGLLGTVAKFLLDCALKIWYCN